MPTIGRFGAVGCAMVTPFDGEGRVDLDVAVSLARWLCAHGNDFLVIAGTFARASYIQVLSVGRPLVKNNTLVLVPGEYG